MIALLAAFALTTQTQTSQCPQDCTVNQFLHDSSWQGRMFAILKTEGMAVGMPAGSLGRGSRLPSRYEYAVGVNAAVMHAGQVLNEAKTDFDNPKLDETQFVELQDAVGHLEGWKSAVPLLQALIDNFSPELKSIEADTAELHARVATFPAQIEALQARVPQFADLPPNHWAAADVLALRRAGIIDGYSGNKENRFGR